MEQRRSTIKLVFCYAREDEKLLEALKKHLSPLQRQNLIDVWYDRNISPGTLWDQEIKKRLDEAQIILLLISPSFIASEYCYGTEMRHASERYRQGEARIIPILLRPILSSWKGVPLGNIQLGQLQALPKDAKPVISWTKRDKAWQAVAEGIRKVVTEFSLSSLFPARSVHADVANCSWQGDYAMHWGSDTEQYESDLHVDIGTFNPYVNGYVATGYYNYGIVSGNIVYQDADGEGYLRFIGTWQRTQGHSGGLYQYGQFYLDLTENNNGRCQVLGHWTYGNIDPVSGQPSWTWTGSKVDEQTM